jgi:plasminogen activator
MDGGMGTNLLTMEDSPISITIQGSVEYVLGESKEYVYDTDTGAKVSQLDWDLDDIVMVGGIVTVGFTDWLQLNLGGWTAVNEGHGDMVDRDWTPEISPDWSHWSKSPVRLDHGHIIDVNLGVPLKVFDWFTVTPLAGFKFDNWKWSDRGGVYIYSKGGWRNDTGKFSDTTGIIYEQWFYAPYLGVNLAVERKGFFVNAYGKGSLWAWSDAEDQHLNTNFEFDDHVRNQDYIGAGLELGYNVTDRFYFMVAYDYQKFSTEKGDTDLFNGATGERGTDHNSGGIGHESNAVRFSLGFKF